MAIGQLGGGWKKWAYTGFYLGGGGKSYHRNQQKFVIKEEVNFPALAIKLFVRVVF